MPRRQPQARGAFRGPFLATLCAGLACILSSAVLMSFASPIAGSPQAREKKLKNRNLYWNPPKLDSPVRSVVLSPPCDLASVLQQAAASTSALITELQNFTAQEEISYQNSDRQGFIQEAGSESFDYVVIFNHSGGKPLLQESRKATRGSNLSAIANQSRGLPELVLMFLPNIQPDYEMKCEGLDQWQGQRAWVVHFQQRPDKPSRTFSFQGLGELYPTSLKGHAWIAADSGEVVHLETGLMQGIPAAKLHQWSLAIDYVPVQFRARDVKIWLPESADTYTDFGDDREIVYHTFKDFMLFSTETEQKIEKPKQP